MFMRLKSVLRLIGGVSIAACLLAATPLLEGAIVADGDVNLTPYGVYYIGYLGDGNLTVNSGLLESLEAYIAYNSGVTGEATVTGDGSTWTNSSSLYIGLYGNGKLNVEEGGCVNNNAVCYLGCEASSTGEVTVTGVGSTWTNNYEPYIGYFGSGTMNIEAGGQVSTWGGYLGYEAGSMGEATVSGAGSTWTNSGNLDIGENGNGTLHIENGGQVNNRSGYLGGGASSTGEVTVTGTGSTWTNSSSLSVGRGGRGILHIEDGGLVSVATLLSINDCNGEDSFIEMSNGGMLALTGDVDDSLDDFLYRIVGTDDIRYWDDSLDGWTPITNATRGVDYTLVYLDNAGSDLYGYTLLTVGAVPEPSVFVLLVAGGMGLLGYRGMRRMR